ncbi:DUF1835 domain-containing protein [Robertkochia aurantiaca]|uniref:DUF1835 domain-containing protein n=1 Tax=Robertkochia aurantiaca TaxID=2873700 RepID=UPI001CD008A8|nr:DUF1835 domain-containing protein [Robertkochia sp. 3YJGBD-33]
MSYTLHITNGDSLTSKLRELDIAGEIITWREMLCEGKTLNHVGSEKFWRQRYEFLSQSYKVTKNTFIDFTLKEYRKLCNHKSQNEIILWFEPDLFCQINQIAVLSWIKNHRKDLHISVVNAVKEDGAEKFFQLSSLSGEQLKELYDDRISLERDDIEYADYIWQLYCENNPFQLQQAIKLNKSKLHYLSKAMEAHLRRFPSVNTGMNELEYSMLQSAYQEKHKSRNQLITSMLNNQGIYGFGDVQFEHMSKKLRPLFRTFNPVKLTRMGKSVMEDNLNVYSQLKNDNEYFGGTPKYSFLFINETSRLLKM